MSQQTDRKFRGKELFFGTTGVTLTSLKTNFLHNFLKLISARKYRCCKNFNKISLVDFAILLGPHKDYNDNASTDGKC